MESLVQNKDQVHDPALILQAMKGLNYPVSIGDPAARITTSCADAFERLDAVGYGDFSTENPKHMLKVFLERVRPPALKAAMEDRLKVEVGLEKNVKVFITRLKDDAKACQAFGQLVGPTTSSKQNAGSTGMGNRTRDSK